jgi:hypothetical protein
VNTKTLAKQYHLLTAEERFRLIAAAGARGDTVEQDRLGKASPHVSFSTRDYTPWARAFDEIATITFMELLEDAAKYRDCHERWSNEVEMMKDEDEKEEEGDEEAADESEADLATPEADTDAPEERSNATRFLDLFLAQGFFLKTKADGWKLFCDRFGIPPFALWELYPGYERLKWNLEMTEDSEQRPGAAFLPEGMLRVLRTFHPDNKPAPTLDNLISPQKVADEFEEFYQQRVVWWGG